VDAGELNCCDKKSLTDLPPAIAVIHWVVLRNVKIFPGLIDIFPGIFPIAWISGSISGILN